MNTFNNINHSCVFQNYYSPSACPVVRALATVKMVQNPNSDSGMDMYGELHSTLSGVAGLFSDRVQR